MGAEYEWKFEATPEILSAIDEAFAGESHRLSMETTYYDTPSGALSSRRYTLRRRLENETSVCTLKVPAGNARGEWETECERIEDAIPVLTAMGTPEALTELVQEGVVAVCGAKFTRIAKTLSLPGGSVELALDRGVLTGGKKEVPLCEVEVELKDGPVQICDDFATALAAHYSLTVQPQSKFSRALALYKGEENA